MMRGKGDGAWRWVDRDEGPVELTRAGVFWLVLAAAACLGVWWLAALGLGRVVVVALAGFRYRKGVADPVGLEVA